MMQRREFLRRAAMIAAGVIAADQLDVLEMLAPRRLFSGHDFALPETGVFKLEKVWDNGAYGASYSYWYSRSTISDGGVKYVFTTPAPKLWLPAETFQ